MQANGFLHGMTYLHMYGQISIWIKRIWRTVFCYVPPTHVIASATDPIHAVAEGVAE